jgi:hypothetical protein
MAAGPAIPAEFKLQVWATTHGSVEGPLQNNENLISGDRISLQARTTLASNAYLVYCDTHAELTVFPVSNGIAMPAGELRQLPAESKDLTLDHTPGKEVFYVVATLRPLQQSDPALHGVLTGGNTPCGRPLEAALVGAPRAAPVTSHNAAAALPRPTALTVRGINLTDAVDNSVSAAARDDGIVVLGFSFNHRP